MGAFVLLVACGGSETEPPAKDVTPASVTAVSTDTIRGPAGGAGTLPLAVIVKNAAGEPLQGIAVTFAAGTGSGTLGSTSVQTSATGQASTTWTLGTVAGLQTATATVGTLAPVNFRAVAAAGAPAAMTKVAGDAQSALIGTNVAIAPQVRITDGFGNAIAGIPVSFVAATGGGLVNGGTVNTNATGLAAPASWRLGTSVGANTVTATSGTLTATFTATATVGAPAAITLTPATIGELSIGATQQLTPRVVDASGNVIAAPGVAYSTSASSVATVSTSGLITAVGAGTATITATAGTATATVAVSIIGHPSSITASTRHDYGTIIPSDVAFSKSRMFVSVNGTQKIFVYDVDGVAKTGEINILASLQTLLTGTQVDGPLLGITPGVQSRVWFMDPAAGAVVDSLDIDQQIISSVITSTGSRAFSLLSTGEIAVIDVASRTSPARIQIGGGLTQLRMAPGDTTLYVMTNIGLIIEIDARTNTVRQQHFVSLTATDMTISREGLFYLLDGPGNIVRIYDLSTKTVLRSIGIPGFATTIALTPDDQQVWITHSNPAQVSIYTGNRNTGFRASGIFSTGLALPLRTYINPSGSIAAVTNIGGWIDIIR
jgi:hypothetical protein